LHCPAAHPAGMAELADAKVSKTFERKLVRVRPPLPAPFKSSTCSTGSVRSGCFRSKIVPEMCLTRFRERDDRARGEAVDLRIGDFQCEKTNGRRSLCSGLVVLDRVFDRAHPSVDSPGSLSPRGARTSCLKVR